MQETPMLNLPIHPIILEDIASVISNQKIQWNKLQSKTVLITGASGLIGSYLVYSLLGLNELKHTNMIVLALVRNREKAEKQFGRLLDRDDLILLYKDVTEPITYPDKIHYIIHTASKTGPQAMMEDPVGTITANVVGSLSLLEYSRKYNSVFLYLSSREIYGNNSSEVNFIRETDYGVLDPTLVRSCYPESKRMSETLCASYRNQYGIDTKIARLSHVYGPDWNLGSGRVWGEFLSNEVCGDDIVLKSNGLAQLAFTYVGDAVSALFFVLLNAEEFVYNIADANGVVTVRDLAEYIANLHPEKKLKTVFETVDQSCYSTSQIALLNTDKIEKLGWKAYTSLMCGLLKSSRVFKDYMNQH